MHLCVKRTFLKNNQPFKFQIGDHDFFLLILWNNHCVAQICLLIGTVFQVSDVAHGPTCLPEPKA